MADITKYTAEQRRRMREQALKEAEERRRNAAAAQPVVRKTAPVVTKPMAASQNKYTYSRTAIDEPGKPPAIRSTPDVYRREVDKKFVTDMMNNSTTRIGNFSTKPSGVSGLTSNGNVNVPFSRVALAAERNQLAANLNTLTRLQSQYADSDDQEMKDLLANAYGLHMDLNSLLDSHGEYLGQFDNSQQQAAFEYDQEMQNTPDVLSFDQWRDTYEGFENDKRTADPTTAWQYDQHLNTLIDYAMEQPSLRESVTAYLNTENEAYDEASRAVNAAEREIEGMWASPRESLDEAAMNIHGKMDETDYYSLADAEEQARLAANEAAPKLSRAEYQLYYNELNDQYGFKEIEAQKAELKNGGLHENEYEAFKKAAAVNFGMAEHNGEQSPLYHANPVEVATYLSLIPPEDRAKGIYANPGLFGNKGWEAAEAYLSYLTDRLDQRANYEVSEKMRQFYDFAAADNGWEKLGKGVAGTVTSVAGGVLQGVHSADIYGQAFQRALTGSKEPIHFYSTSLPTEYASIPREAISGELDKLGDVNSLASKIAGKDVDIKGWGNLGVDSVYNSFVDNMTSLANVTLFGRRGMGAAMGLQAAAPAMNEAHEAGASDARSILYGTGVGAAEGIGEQVGFERFLQLGQKHGLFNSKKGKLLLGMVLQPLNEGVGEAATERLDQYIDRYILDENSDYQRRVQAYISQGIAPEEAEARVDQEMGEQVVDAMLQGVLGGAMFSGGYYAADAINRAATGKASKRKPALPAKPKVTEGTSEAAKERAEARLAGMKTAEGEQSMVVDETGTEAPVTVHGITQTGKDAMVTVSDGQTDRQVKLADVAMGSDANSEVYAYAADMATPELANVFRGHYESTQDISQVANGMQYAYDMAEQGGSIDLVRRSVMTSELTSEQLQDAYNLGMAKRTENIKSLDKAASERMQRVLGNDWHGGTVDMGDVVEASLSDKQIDDVETLRAFAGVSGYNIKLFRSAANAEGRYTRENGRYDRSTNTIWIDVNAGRNNANESMVKTAMLRTLSHETTHAIQANAPEVYARLQTAVLDVLEKQGVDIDDRIAHYMSIDSSVKTRAAALDEVVADACETMLRDSDAAQKFKEAHPEEARTLGQKILEIIKDITGAIKRAFAGEAGAKSDVSKALLKDMDAFRKVAEIWTEGALQTGEVMGRENGRPIQQTAEASESETATETVEETVGPFDEPVRPAEAHIDQRDWDNVADDDVRAFQNDYKFARNWMGLAARALSYDVDASIPGKRFMNADGEWQGQKRQTTDLLASLKDEGKWTWDQVKAGLDKIASYYENGDIESEMPNSRRIKRIELALDEMLSEGYTTMDGVEIAPDRGWLEYKKELPGAKDLAIPENAVYGAYEVRYQARAGYTEDGTAVYTSNFPEGTTRPERQARILQLVQEVWSKNPIKLMIQRNGREETITAKFDPYVDPAGRTNSDATKLAFGNRKGSSPDQRTTEKLADDFPEIISNSEYSHTTQESGKETAAHRGVLVWHYFANKIGFINEKKNYAEYNVTVDVKEKEDGDYVYAFAAVKIKGSERPKAPTLYSAPGTINAPVRGISPANATNSIPQPASDFNPEIKKSSRAKSDPDIEELLRIHNEYREAQRELEESKRKLNELTDHPKMLEIFDELMNLTVSRFNPEGKAKNREMRKKIKAVEEELGIPALSGKVRDLEERVRDLYRQEQEFETTLAQKRETAAIEKSGLSEADYFRKQAVKEFGYTSDFVDAGYLLPNGKMLNFSGEKGKHFGTRGQDHRAIGVIYEGTTGSAALTRFMNGGNIRIMAESPGIDIAADAEPTTQQYAKIRAFVREYANKRFFNVDISDAQGMVLGSYTYNGAVNADRVVNDIKYYYENGSFREQSQLGDFLYSLRDPYEVSDREILANALENAAKNADEKAWLAAYKKDLGQLNEYQAELDKNRAVVRELLFKAGRTSDESSDLAKAQERVKHYADKLAKKDKALLKIEAAAPLRAIVDREGKKVRDAMREREKAKIADIRATQENAAFRKRIVRKVKHLDELLRNPTDQKHVPDNLKAATLDMLKVFTDDTSVFDREKLERVRREYAELTDRDADTSAAGMYDEDTAERIKMLADTIGGQRLSKLNRMQLEEVMKVIDHFAHLVKDANTVFVNGRRENIEAITAEIVDQTLSKGAMKLNKLKNSAMWKLLFSGQITPVYFFKHIGGGFKRLGDSILAGESKFGVNALKAREKIQSLMDLYNYHSWANQKGDVLKLNTENGATLEMTREQALALYATYKRETTNTLQAASHLRTGGVILPKDSKKLNWFKGTEDIRNGAPISDADMNVVKNWLTAEQMEYADAMVEYLSKDLSRMGNETSRALHGYSKFGEGYYFPYKTSANFRRTNLETVEQALIKNMGFTKSVVRRANTPVELYDFTTTVAEHVNNMLMYTSFAEAQDAFIRVYDHKVDANNTIKSMLQTSFGTNTKNYMEQFLKDIYGGVTADKREDVPNRFLSAFKRNAVMGSLSVAIQQPTSIARAFALVDPKHFAVPGIEGGFIEAMNYAGTAVIKDMGRFDTISGRSVAEWLAKDKYKGFENVTAYFKDAEHRADVHGIIPEVADKVTWGAIWKAVKHEQAQATGLDINSEELKVIAGRRFDEVIRRTQVYDSVMAKSEVMRSKSFGMKMITAFMAEPTVTYNMGVDAVVEAKAGNKKTASKLLTAMIMSSVLNNLAKSLVTAARDDEDEPYVEKYLAAVFGGLLNDINPMNYVPLLKDMVSIFQGYDVARTDMNVITDIVTAMEQEIKLAVKGDARFWDYAKPAAAVLSMLTAVPIKNWWRDIEGVGTTVLGRRGDFAPREGGVKRAAVESSKEWLSGIFYSFWSDSKKNNANRIVKAAISGNADAVHELREYMKTFNGMDDKQIKTSVTSAVKAQFESGDITDEDAVIILSQYADHDSDEAEAKVNKWKYETDTGSSYTDMKDQFLAGDLTVEEAVQARMEYGGMSEEKARKTVSEWQFEKENSFAYDDMEDAFKAGEIGKQAAMQARIDAGADEEDAYWDVTGWEYENQTGQEWKGRTTKLNAAMKAGNLKAVEDAMTELYDHTSWKNPSSEMTGSVTAFWKPLYIAASDAERDAMLPLIYDCFELAYTLNGEEYYGDDNVWKNRIKRWKGDD